MLVSLTWLRALCSVTESVEEVAEALTSRGLTVDAVSPAGDDHVLDIDIPANRPDCLGHLGLARELSAAFGVPLAERAAPPRGTGPEVGSSVTVAIDDPDLCWRYTARLVRDVAIGPSPDWVARRLEACGLRSINNVVDASNLVMLESGNPIHFFDLERIGEATVRIRRAAPGETLTTLDGIERALEPEMLVIADAVRPIAVAGVMGGADSEIGISTRDVLIEAAHFLRGSVRSTSRRLGLKTDASHRFERGVDPEGATLAQDLAVSLLSRENSSCDRASCHDCSATTRGPKPRSKPCARCAWRLSRWTGSVSRSPFPRGESTSNARPTLSRRSRATSATTAFRPGRPAFLP
jgi:phenylalanyl-tRNA synthetase beta chain